MKRTVCDQSQLYAHSLIAEINEGQKPALSLGKMHSRRLRSLAWRESQEDPSRALSSQMGIAKCWGLLGGTPRPCRSYNCEAFRRPGRERRKVVVPGGFPRLETSCKCSPPKWAHTLQKYFQSFSCNASAEAHLQLLFSCG